MTTLETINPLEQEECAENEELQQDVNEHVKTNTVDIVSILAYLLGIRKDTFDEEMQLYKMSTFEALEENRAAKTIRSLCSIRNTLIHNYKKVDSRIRFDLMSIDRMDDLFDLNDFKYLESVGIKLVKANRLVYNYLLDINKLIIEHINACKSLFPLWIKWDYLKELFIMPGAQNEANVISECNRLIVNRSDYPFGAYLSWTARKKGNILYNDRKFLDLLYRYHGRVFDDFSKVTDASISTKKSIYNFLKDNDDTVLVVDCENSDPYKLFATLKGLKREELCKITKIILLNDIHTSTAWQIFENFSHIPVKYLMIERIKNDKSLVDIKVTTETCREHYVNGINSFVLCSSDSDYWGLITSLPDAEFLVMIEKNKCGKDLQNAMNEKGIVYCCMDDFSDGTINNIKVKALICEMDDYISRNLSINVNDMLDRAYARTRIEMNAGERKQFYDNYVKTMRLFIDDDGIVEIKIKDND